MQEIKCPKCGEIFTVDESGYQQIAHQVRDEEFKKEIQRREKEIRENQQKEAELLKIQQQQQNQLDLAKKDSTISEKEKEIAELKAKLLNAETEKQLAVSSAVSEKEKEIMSV